MATKGATRTTNSLNKDLEDILDNKKLVYFVRWYCKGADPNEYEKIKVYLNEYEMDKAINSYLEREDVQKAIQYITKFNKDNNLIKIYNVMVDKALQGDCSCATWVVNFSKSEFFESRKNEIDDIIDGLSLDE